MYGSSAKALKINPAVAFLLFFFVSSGLDFKYFKTFKALTIPIMPNIMEAIIESIANIYKPYKNDEKLNTKSSSDTPKIIKKKLKMPSTRDVLESFVESIAFLFFL